MPSFEKFRTHQLLVATCLVGAAGLFLLWVVDPATSGLFPPCPVRYLTGFYCPGCGSLRAMHALLHGELQRAWAMNPFTIVMLPFLGYGLASEILFAVRGKGLPHVKMPANSIRALALGIVLFGIARNLPMHPFDLLAPGGAAFVTDTSRGSR